ncbi:LacI family DNA-binding transcriptional regulator [Jiangella aurantiaca]|uniref:LacI family DNA-binding transcriptional regulator n=1 Tax=Jiangella aurantiaca TaxID=2530373 RepID=A0A4V2YT76_9ACTN|nr:LacI family DNA-binding transcriptional regulator [Jiangella aurantiaca]
MIHDDAEAVSHTILADMARAAQVSVPTVSRVVSDTQYV